MKRNISFAFEEKDPLVNVTSGPDVEVLQRVVSAMLSEMSGNETSAVVAEILFDFRQPGTGASPPSLCAIVKIESSDKTPGGLYEIVVSGEPERCEVAIWALVGMHRRAVTIESSLATSA